MEGARQASPQGKPLTRDISVGSASQGAQATRRSCAVLLGDQKRSARGSVDHAVVVVDRFGCRNRQAARGLRAHRRKTCGHVEGLALPCESIGKAKERRKPAQGWLNRGHGGGLSQKEHLSVEGASSCQAVPFDEGVGKAVLVLRGVRATAFLGAGCEASEVKSHSLARG